jgi:hypothetical protein
MIVAFEILRNSGSSAYHNETTMNFETEAKRRSNPSKTASTQALWNDAAQVCG